jgi:hypothetical protein
MVVAPEFAFACESNNIFDIKVVLAKKFYEGAFRKLKFFIFYLEVSK